jgi:hypothetical protein
MTPGWFHFNRAAGEEVAMASVELAESWDMAGDVGSVQARVRGFFERHRMRVTGEQPGEVHAWQGRRLLATLLGRRSPPAWLPKRAFVKLKRLEAGVAVRAGIEDEAGGGNPGERLRDKYRTYFEWWMEELKQAIGDAGPRTRGPTAT